LNPIPDSVAEMLHVGGWIPGGVRAFGDKQEAFERFAGWMDGISLGDAERLAKRRTCGVSDQLGTGVLGAAVAKWGKLDLTWRLGIGKEVGGYTPNQWRSIFTQAAGLWTAGCAITFTEVDHAGADILFLCDTRSPLGRANGVLAYADLPYGEDAQLRMTIDEAEPWARQGPNWTVGVVAHEIGHLLGLGHSNDGRDLMYPYISNVYTPSVGDLAYAIGQYGKPKPKPVPIPIPVPNPPQTPIEILFNGPLVGTDATGRTVRVFAR
jgi:hypothetical protein